MFKLNNGQPKYNC